MVFSDFPPPLTAPSALNEALKHSGFAVLSARDVSVLSSCSLAQLNAWRHFWEGLPADAYLKDGGHYRRRRHSCFTVSGQNLVQVPHRAHWQSLAYNALHGGMRRMFEPMLADLLVQAEWRALLVWLGQVCSDLKGARPWFVEAHQFRIDTTDGIGRPTPEGAHRDGVDLVAVFMVERSGIKGGETRVFDAAGPNGQRFTLSEPWSLLLLDDARMIHESTPIQQAPVQRKPGHRDTLVITLRGSGFQGDSQEHDTYQGLELSSI